MEITGVKIETSDVRKKAADFSEMLPRYDYGLFYYLSEIKLETMQDGRSPVLEQLMEARLFSETSELHLFQCETGWRAVLVEETGTGQAEYIDDKHVISKEFQTAGKKLCVRKYISYDEDGQAFVALTRLCGVR